MWQVTIELQNIVVPTLGNILEDSQTYYAFEKVPSSRTCLEQEEHQLWNGTIEFQNKLNSMFVKYPGSFQDLLWFWKATTNQTTKPVIWNNF